MHEQLQFILRHSYLVLFLLSLGAQLGLPVPSGTALLAAGALAQAGELYALPVVALAALAALIGHGAWFFAGRRGGHAVLRFICKISLEPDSCVRRTNDFFTRFGAKSLLVAPFVPGFATVAPPLAGTTRMPFARFLALDSAGAVIWAASMVGVGYLLGPALETVGRTLLPLGPLFAALVVLAVAGYVAFKLWQREKLFTDLDVPRITPEELQLKLTAGETPVLVDLRHPSEISTDPELLPGAVNVSHDEVACRLHHLPPDREIILYCN